ncbi:MULTISPECIES: helix-turn-helix domain-containing protein [Streptomyces]|uniref:helix-turn-helix domain-containing protein n=1 Tax=Streptomyces TaxID=1883 RepID=UPI00163BCBAD|nr:MULTISPECIES: XRE family transcriptional regulator [Streptomyces]MBC2879519.1 helix-turn-helix transcriptional regulator [Streptomyces sp. TYQ1024]UBI35003.1 XRE family transcriptional regulator [Streptomyces mobaraensis]UKW27603.1 XRE family transcriptional regulator [Streptomyces sp. TYQ1024]
MVERDGDTAEPQHGDDLAGAFGGNVRRRREEAGLTLEQLSTRSSVSRAMLSKVERGEKSPTIGVASRIAHALDASLSDLIGAPAAAASGVAVAMRENERPVFRDPETGFERHIVSAAPGAGRAEMVLHHLPAQISTGLLPAYPPGTEKQLLVLRGTLTVAIGGINETLHAGDSLFLQADADHGFANRTSAPCEYIMVISRPT